MKINLNIISKNKTTQQVALSLAALAVSTLAWSNPIFDQPDTNFNAMLRTTNVVYPGQNAEVIGSGFQQGQEVQLLRGTQVLSGDKPLVADEKGEIRLNIAIPNDAVLGLHPVIVQVSKPAAATVFELKISPDIKPQGEKQFTITNAPVTNGLYQIAYSPKNDALFVTSSVGRPPVKESQLSKIDPKTLTITAKTMPAVDPERAEQVMAIYGLAIDDKNGTVWTTNTRAGTVAVYDQNDLTLIKQFEHNSAPHSRDVVVDAELDRVFVSSPTSDQLYVFNTKTLDALEPITIPSNTRQAFAAMSLSYDLATHTLYTVSRSSNELALIDGKQLKPIKTITLPGIKNASGVAVAPTHKRAFVTGQASDNVVIIDLDSDAILHNVLVGAGALNVLWDEKTQLAYVANRGSDTLTVININGDIVANLPVGSFPNHLTTDSKGHVYLVNKSRGKDDKSGDHITKIQQGMAK